MLSSIIRFTGIYIEIYEELFFQKPISPQAKDRVCNVNTNFGDHVMNKSSSEIWTYEELFPKTS